MAHSDWTGIGRDTAEVYRAMAERLAALIWPEQTERAERLDRALDIVRDDPPRLETGDLLRDVPALVADAPAGATIVVFHSAVLAYLGPESGSNLAKS
jgi:hypothetical protein